MLVKVGGEWKRVRGGQVDGKPRETMGVPPLGTPEQVAEFLGVPVATLYQWRHRGSGPRASRVGRHIRYRWADVERWLDEQSGRAIPTGA